MPPLSRTQRRSGPLFTGLPSSSTCTDRNEVASAYLAPSTACRNTAATTGLVVAASLPKMWASFAATLSVLEEAQHEHGPLLSGQAGQGGVEVDAVTDAVAQVLVSAGVIGIRIGRHGSQVLATGAWRRDGVAVEVVCTDASGAPCLTVSRRSAGFFKAC